MTEIEAIIGLCLGCSSLAFGLLFYLMRDIVKHEAEIESQFDALRAHQRSPVRYTKGEQIVKLAGRVEYADETLTSPLNQERCVSWYARVFSPGSPGSGDGWDPPTPMELHLSERQTCRFLLRDATGVALIHAEGARILIQLKRRKSPAPRLSKERRRDNVRALLRLNDKPEHLAVWNAEEFDLLTEGMQVAVFGLARWESGGYRDAPQRLVLHAPPDGALLISDDPKKMR